jgi:hypothetical protein
MHEAKRAVNFLFEYSKQKIHARKLNVDRSVLNWILEIGFDLVQLSGEESWQFITTGHILSSQEIIAKCVSFF